jgi:bifunctional UDP-N-acetylglucosamine pyrophosphorylase/glucosamine-1-phosphate N-acetyltransferase
MIEFLITSARKSNISDILVVGGYGIGLLRQSLVNHALKIIKQKRLLGSADAVKQAAARFKNFNGILLVLYADTPLIIPATIRAMLKKHASSNSDVTLLSTEVPDPREYGRIRRDGKGNIRQIIEHIDIANTKTENQTPKTEINVGAYCFDAKKLFEGIKCIKKNKRKGEYYLTDIIAHFYEKGYRINSYVTKDADEALGINRRQHLQAAEGILRKRTMRRLLDQGIIIKDPASAYIEEGVKIGKDTIIYPFVVIEAGVVIGSRCKIGPFAHLRRGTVLKKGSSVGNYVEIVRSTIGEGSRAKHHSYIGDTVVGKDVNIGAGTITANYDGKNKNRTIIRDRAFIGSGTTIVAPVKIGKGAITGAGSVVVKGKDVLPGSVVVGVPARPLYEKSKLKTER